MTYDLSVLIPSRNEEHLARTVRDVLENSELRTEVIVVIDGEHIGPPVEKHPRVTIVDLGVSVGQRAAVNAAARLSRAKYILKLDAHSAFSKGFDRVLVAACSDRMTTVCPVMRNLDAETWKPKPNCLSAGWRFDHNIEFQYWDRPIIAEPHEVLCCWGGCWMMDRERFFEIGGLDESIGSLGQMAEEVSLKTWLSGGQVLCDSRAWCAHGFGFGRHYKPRGSYLRGTRRMWLENRWPLQTRPLSWLLDKFSPVPGWHDAEGAEQLEKVRAVGKRFTGQLPTQRMPDAEIVWYTDHWLRPDIGLACRHQLDKARGNLPLISIGLNRPADFGTIQLSVRGGRSYLSIYKQIVAGLEAARAPLIFLAEHDVLYASEHFHFRPRRGDAYWYNNNRWILDAQTGRVQDISSMKAMSHLCGCRDLLLDHFRKRVARIEREGWRWVVAASCEPGISRPPIGIDDIPAACWTSKVPNLDIRLHGSNWTAGGARRLEWSELSSAPGWPESKDKMQEFFACIQQS